MNITIYQSLFYDKIPDCRKTCIDSVDRFFPTIVRTIRPSIEFPIVVIDNMKYEILEAHDYKKGPAIWVDDDINFDSTPIWDFSGLALPRIGTGWDTFIIYSPNKEWISTMKSDRKSRGIGNVYGWPNKLFRNMHIQEIPTQPEIWQHLRLSGYSEGIHQYNKYDCSIQH